MLCPAHTVWMNKCEGDFARYSNWKIFLAVNLGKNHSQNSLPKSPKQIPTVRIIYVGISMVSFFGLTQLWAEGTPNCNSIKTMVLIETNKEEYRQDEEIVVTVTNNSDANITTFDQQAFCTIIRLERQVGKEWREMRNCFSGVPSRFVTLNAHTETIALLPPLSSGVFKASLIFTLGKNFNFGKSTVISSTPFKVT
jgi:hypothetical protein